MSHTFAICNKCNAVNKVKTEKIPQGSAVCGKCQTPISFHKFVTEVSSIGFDKIISNSDLPVVVDFWAPWCGPCRSFAPTFEKASEIEQGRIVFIKINTEQFPEISNRLGIRGIPTLMVFKNGKEIARESGAFPLEMFLNWLKQF